LRVIVGLGNPGDRYARTRHNIGARVIERASAQWSIPLKTVGSARLGTGLVGPSDRQVEVTLATPHTWMNQSGTAVSELLARSGCGSRDLTVVHDDLDMEPGRLRLKRSGGAGGHNGVSSIIAELNSDQFCRLKLGIGRPAPGEDPADYVLEPFTQDEATVLEASVEQAVQALECLMVEGIDAAMNKFNVHDIQESDE
jgi:peptidyl-tRNA hydrolase, PTH1 family